MRNSHEPAEHEWGNRIMRLQRFRVYFVVVIMSCTLRPVFGGTEEALPLPLIQAAAAYKARGAEGFVPTLINGSRLQYTNESSLSQAIDALRMVEYEYGKYLGIEMVGSITISESARVVYFVLKYERGPLYGVADIYKTKLGEIVTNSNVNTDINLIMPPEILAKIK